MSPQLRVFSWPAGTTATWTVRAEYDDNHAGDRIPLVVVPGGPGLPHGYLRSLAGLARPGRPVVFYDPLGCGYSQHNGTAPDDWNLSLFVQEFRALVEHAASQGECFVLGHSSGGWVALEALISDVRLRSMVVKLVLASTPLDIPAFLAEQRRLIAALGPLARRRLRRPPPQRPRPRRGYAAVYDEFLHRHICRRPWPPELADAFDHANRDVYETLWGASEVSVTGSLRTWSAIDRTGELTMPVLLTSGRHDEVTPDLMHQAVTQLPGAQWRLFEHSAHMPHLSETGPYLDAVDTFLREPADESERHAEGRAGCVVEDPLGGRELGADAPDSGRGPQVAGVGRGGQGLAGDAALPAESGDLGDEPVADRHDGRQ
jgi:L-proline amide hydrolase